jgi:oligosaccharide repeat unit polymerase
VKPILRRRTFDLKKNELVVNLERVHRANDNAGGIYSSFSPRPIQLRIFEIIFIFIGLLIVLLNLFFHGYFPLFSAFGIKTLDYLSYGRIKNILFPILSLLMLCSIFEQNKKMKYTCFSLPIIIGLLYMARGATILSLLQYILLYFGINKINIKKVLISTIISIFFLTNLMWAVGAVRMSNEALLAAFDVKKKYHDYNPGLVWVAAYISLPYANLLDFVEKDFRSPPGIYFTLEEIIPSISQNEQVKELYFKYLPLRSNTVSTYIGQAFLDFGYIGIIVFNFVYGFIGGLFSLNFIKKRFIFPNVIYLSALLMMFFTNFLIFFSTFFEMILSIFLFKYAFQVNRFTKEV